MFFVICFSYCFAVKVPVFLSTLILITLIPTKKVEKEKNCEKNYIFTTRKFTIRSSFIKSSMSSILFYFKIILINEIEMF